MANYKIKDLPQAQTLNGAVALEIQDGDHMSTFTTLDQVSEFLGISTPVLLRVKSNASGELIPDMTTAAIAASYLKILIDPVHNIPVIVLSENQYIIPFGYGVNNSTVTAYYSSHTFVQPYKLTLNNSTFTISRNGKNKDVKRADLSTRDQLYRLEIALRANGSDVVYSSPNVTIEASDNAQNYVEVPIGSVNADDQLSLSLGGITITSGTPSSFTFVLVNSAGGSVANVLNLRGNLGGTFTIRTSTSDARLRMYAGGVGGTAGVGVEYDVVMLIRGRIPAERLSLLYVLDKSKEYTDRRVAGLTPTPSGSPLHDLFVSKGAIWNANTGYWELNGLTDITTEQMIDIYNMNTPFVLGVGYPAFDYPTHLGRTTFPMVSIFSLYSIYFDSTWNHTREVLRLSKYWPPHNPTIQLGQPFQLRYFTELKRIVDILDTQTTTAIIYFEGCAKLEEVKIKNLKRNINLSTNGALNLGSFKYFIDNAANTTAITVIVHADIYAKLTDPSDTEWYAVNTAAQAKQISFATA